MLDISGLLLSLLEKLTPGPFPAGDLLAGCIVHQLFFVLPRRHRAHRAPRKRNLKHSINSPFESRNFATLLANDSSFVDNFFFNLQQLHRPLFARPSLSATIPPLAPAFALTVQAQTDSDTIVPNVDSRVSRLRTTIQPSLRPSLRLRQHLRFRVNLAIPLLPSTLRHPVIWSRRFTLSSPYFIR